MDTVNKKYTSVKNINRKVEVLWITDHTAMEICHGNFCPGFPKVKTGFNCDHPGKLFANCRGYINYKPKASRNSTCVFELKQIIFSRKPERKVTKVNITKCRNRKCMTCMHIFPSDKLFHLHISSCSALHCNICNMQSSIKDLKEDNFSHTKERPFKFHFCKEYFFT